MKENKKNTALKWIGIGVSALTAVTGVITIIHRIKEDSRSRKSKEEQYRLKHAEREEQLQHQKKLEEIKTEAKLDRIRRVKELKNTPTSIGEEDDDPTETEFPSYSSYKPSELTGNTNLGLKPMVGMLLPEGYDSILYSSKGNMKSYLTLNILVDLAAKQSPEILPPAERMEENELADIFCIYVDGENGQTVIKQRLGSMASLVENNLIVIEQDRFGDGEVDKLFSAVQSSCMERPDGSRIVVALDNVISLAGSTASKASKKFLNQIKKLRSGLKARNITLTTITVCHTEKTGSRLAGSYTLSALAPYVFRLDSDGRGNLKKLTVEETRTGNKGDVYRLKVLKCGNYTYLAYNGPSQGQGTGNATSGTSKILHPTQEQCMAINALHERGVSWDRIAAMEEYPWSRPTIERWVRYYCGNDMTQFLYPINHNKDKEDQQTSDPC